MESLDRKSNKKYQENFKRISLKKIYKSAINSYAGLRQSYSKEQSLTLHLVVSIFVVILGIVFKINRYEWVMSIILLGMIVGMELLNTAIEANVDLVTTREHPLAKEAKDVGSAATFLMSILAFIGEIIIFYPSFMNLFK